MTIAIALLLPAVAARAEVTVSGSKAALVVDARNASLRDVVQVIARATGLHINVSSPLNVVVNGRYAGSLRQVLGRILDGQNYVVGSAGDGMTIVLVRNNEPANAHRPIMPVPPPPAMPAMAPAAAAAPVNAPPAGQGGAPVALDADGEPFIVSPVQGWSGGFSYRPNP